MLAYSRFRSRQSLNAAAPAAALESALLRTSLNNKGDAKTSSHVNINEISEYNKQQRRQRPQTGKLRNTSAAQQFSAGNASQGFVVIGPLQSQITSHHRRLTSAKQDLRFKTKHLGGAGGPESHLSNTRDVIQSNGYLTTMAGSNLEAVSRGT